ncbi:MAG: DUF3179 domain-containing protein [Hyphomicrobiales bacterium]|nr:DUF3179 domain-containing protein [Hyphomicrobiales bacterium]
MNTDLNRRVFLGGAAGLASLTILSGSSLIARRTLANEAPPFPTLAEGRYIPRTPADYADAMLSGGPGKDGIPAIDSPQFWDAERASEYLDDGDIVFGLVENGEARAYPQRILVWHEIVNDVVGGTGLAVTYCPLTGTAIAFERGTTEFGVSGRLVNSNLIMYDRDTDTWFPQILAVGTSGPHVGAALVERPVIWTNWRRWREAYPDTGVLSTETGFLRNYRSDPYGAYNDVSGYYLPDSATLFPLMNDDGRHPPKTIFLLARTTDRSVAFNMEELRATKKIEATADGETFTAIYDDRLDTGYVFSGRTVAVPRIEGPSAFDVNWTGGEALRPINSFLAMWFAVTAFYPETVIHV